MSTNDLTIEVIETDKRHPAKFVDIVENKLFNYNSSFIKTYNQVSIFLKNKSSKEIKGGLVALIRSGVMFIETLIVDEGFRSKGLGTQIMKEAENIAIKNKCNCIYLDTFSFQALPFYKKLGYSEFAVLDEYNDNIKLTWVKKSLKKPTKQNSSL